MPSPPDHATEERPTLRESVPPLREWTSTFLIGIFMGSADAVPGVSGGTIALIAGVYERLITAITAVTPDRVLGFLRALTPLDGGVSVRRAVGIFDDVDGWFLVALLGGIVAAVVTVTRIVHVLDTEAPVLLFGFFFGLIAASAVVLLRAISIRTVGAGVAAVVGFVVAFLLSGSADGLLSGGLPVVFLAGAIAVSAMILPGISGSLLLVILGQYTRLSTALSEFVDGVTGFVTGGSTEAVGLQGPVIVVFIAGGLIGLFTVSRLVRAALDRNREATLAFLVALVVGALRAPVAELRGRPDVVFADALLTFVGIAVVGAVFVLALDWYAADFEIEDI
jgi:putative membrane protein